MMRRFPINGTFELTGRCNMNCKMCYVHVDQAQIEKLGRPELSTEQWIDMARQIFEAGTLRLLLTGGEPMLRQDFCEIYEAIAKMGFFVTLYTNATMITPKIMEVLRKYPPHTIGVTVYGMSPETYGKVCGCPNGYERMRKGIEQLMELPSHMELRTTIVQDNLHEAAELERFVKSFGPKVTFNINQTLFQSSRGSIGDAASCRLTPEQNVEFYLGRYVNMVEEAIRDPERLNEIKIKNQQDDSPKESAARPANSTYFGCGAGVDEFTITWDGKLLPCTLMSYFYTDPVADGFRNAWDQLAERIQRPVLSKECTDCAYQEFCGVCPASRYCETGDVNGVPNYFCEIAKAYHIKFKNSGGNER